MNQTLNSNTFFNPVIKLDETARNISKLIEASNLKVCELQNLFGFEQPQAIYNWKEGKTLPSLDNCFKLAYFLHTTIDKIVVLEMQKNEAKQAVPVEFRIEQ